MRLQSILIALLFAHFGTSQGFECDGSFFLVTYTLSTGKSKLYQITKKTSESFNYQLINLSKDRKLNGLSYNVLDKHLYALDVDTYELIQIDKTGKLVSFGIPENLDTSFVYHSSAVSPDGSGIFFLGFNPRFGYDTRFYSLNLRRTNFYAGFLGVTGEEQVIVHDFATDPINGGMYGFDNLHGKLIQVGIGGLISTLFYPATGVKDIDAVFFDREGEMYGYSAERGMYYINKRNGELRFLEKGPEGTQGDGCACPYTFTFTKTIEPRVIDPCEEFEVRYEFTNKMGIGQAWLDFRDTFPENFEITSVSSKIISPSFNILESTPNILALKNIIYLMGVNEILITVRAPFDYTGSFESRASQWDFPAAFDTIHFSDDPTTPEFRDATRAEVRPPEEIDFSDAVQYSCFGDTAFIHSPITAEQYEWSTGSSESFIAVTNSGYYALRAQNECVMFFDSVLIDGFRDPKMISISGPEEVELGSPFHLTATNPGNSIVEHQWTIGDSILHCFCPDLEWNSYKDVQVKLVAFDDAGCEWEASHNIFVREKINTYVANAFSPNADLVNDYFFIQSSLAGWVREFRIYSRWGNEVFSGYNIALNDEHSGWDGSFKSQPLEADIYMWVAQIEYANGAKERRSGSIVLVR